MTTKMQTARACVEQENKDSVLYNHKLKKHLPQIEASLTGSKILYANIYGPLMDMIQNPRKYGFKETKKGCCGTGLLEAAFLCNDFTKTCPHHSDHMFWDSIHPSEASYNYLGNFIDAQIRGWAKV
ncbi:unnamed protein product [Microthlaspi erraticum]|nr:unnamed protein product [Microthlaspi erraticum]